MTAKKLTARQLGTKADQYYTARFDRLALEKKVKKLQEKENALKEELIDNIPKSNLKGIAGKIASVKVFSDPVPVIDDMKKLFAYIKRNKAEDLLCRPKLSVSAVRERWAAKKKIPGIGEIKVVKISLSKLK